MPGPERDLALLVSAARTAGEIALRYWRQDPRAWDKPGNAGPVTEADLAVDTHLRETLTAARPDYGWLSEETPDTPARLGAARLFIADPIDGTRAFMAGEAGWAVALAVACAGSVTAGVVHLPARNETYAAARGQGAMLNGAPIRVSGAPEGDGGTILAARPMMEPHHWPGGVPPLTRRFRPALAHRMALVAAGRFDAMATFRPAYEWDVAAGALLIAEAGGVVSDGAGAALRFNNPGAQVRAVVGAGPALHGALIARRGGAGPPVLT